MINLLDKSKIDRFSYFYLFIIIIYAASASQFVRTYGEIHKLSLSSTILLLFTFIFIKKNNIKLNSTFFKVIGCFLLYALITSINNNVVNLIWIYKWILGIIIAFSLIKVFGKRLFAAYETILYHLCVLSILFWVILLLYEQSFTNFIDLISLEPFSKEKETLNIIIYSINNFSESIDSFFKRNAGFSWEPGAFSCFANLGLYCNLLRTDFQIKNNIPLFIFILAILTSQSTTGYTTLIYIFIGWLIARKKFVKSFFLLPVFITIINLPFVKDKIIDQVETNNEFEMSDLSATEKNDVNRAIAFHICWEEFKRHPLLGLGGYDDGTYLRKHNYEIVISSGIGNLLSMYGLVMTITFIFLIIKTTKVLKSTYKSNNSVLFFIPILGMMISYNIWLLPMYITLWMFGIFYKKSINEN